LHQDYSFKGLPANSRKKILEAYKEAHDADEAKKATTGRGG